MRALCLSHDSDNRSVISGDSHDNSDDDDDGKSKGPHVVHTHSVPFPSTLCWLHLI